MVGKNLTEIQRKVAVLWLLQHSENGTLPRGVVNEAAEKWDVTRQRISVLWKRAKKQQELGETLTFKSNRYGNTNRKRILPNIEQIKALDFTSRGTIDMLSKKLKVSVGCVHSWVVEGLLKPHTSRLHPQLTKQNKIHRLKFALEALEVRQQQNQILFKDMRHIIHIDEKWFYLSRDNKRYYVVEGEDLPYRSCQSKRYITKVMFMCAVCRPHYNDIGEVIFDGKIGLFPFTIEQPAVRKSKNRVAGTLETKAIDSITRVVTEECLINKIIPAIKAKWPASSSKNILIQQDNAKPHIKNNDLEFREVASSDGFNIELVFQPPNSPDLNTNDLGFFSALQSLQSAKQARNVVELVSVVEASFSEYSPKKLNKIWLSLQGVMVEIMKVKGHNNFSIPHMKKEQLQSQGCLPINIAVEESLVRECILYLIELGNTSGLEDLMQNLGY